MSTVTCIYCRKEVPRRAPRQVLCGASECLARHNRDCDERKRRKYGVQPLTTKRCEYCDAVIERAQPHQKVCTDLRCRRLMKAEAKRVRERAARQPVAVAVASKQISVVSIKLHPRRANVEAVKAEAVRLKEAGVATEEIARRLGCSTTSVRRWTEYVALGGGRPCQGCGKGVSPQSSYLLCRECRDAGNDELNKGCDDRELARRLAAVRAWRRRTCGGRHLDDAAIHEALSLAGSAM